MTSPDKVSISRTGLRCLMGHAVEGKRIREFFHNLLDSRYQEAEHPNGINWAEMDLDSAIKEATQALDKR